MEKISHHLQNGNRPRSVEEAVTVLRDIHQQTYTRQDALRSTENLIASLYPEMQSLVKQYEELLVLKASNGKEISPEEIQTDVHNRAMMLYNRHSTYSSSQHLIKSMEFGEMLTSHELERIIWEDAPRNTLDRFGMIVLDVNSLGTIKSCIGHRNTNSALQTLSRLLVDPSCKAVAELQEMGIIATPTVAGGDEFTIVLDSDIPLTPELIEKVTQMFEAEINTHPQLSTILNFDEPATLLDYMDVGNKEQEEILDILPSEVIRSIQQDIRKTLPAGIFQISVTGGGVTMGEGLEMALRRNAKDGLDLRQKVGFEEAAKIIFDAMLRLGNSKLDERKGGYKQKILSEDPLLGEFLIKKWDRQLQEKRQLITNALNEMREAIIATIEQFPNGKVPWESKEVNEDHF